MNGRSIALWIVAFLVGAAALAFGSVELWAEEWLRLLVLVAFVAVAWRERPKSVFKGRAAKLLLPAVLFVAWGFIQSVPLGKPLLSALSPKTARTKAEVVPPQGGAGLPAFLLGQAKARGVTIEDGATTPTAPADPVSAAVSTSLSIHPYATRRACLVWLAPLLLVFIAERIARDAQMRYQLLWAIAGWTGVLGAVAVAQQVAGNGKLMWFREIPKDSSPLGPFVNPNHFAGYVEIGILAAVGLALACLAEGSDGRLTRKGIRQVLTDRVWGLPRVFGLSALVVLGLAGLVLTKCRGGQLALIAGSCVLLPLGRLRRLLPAGAVILVVLAFSLGVTSWLGSEKQTLQTGFFAENTGDLSLAMRSDMWGRTWRIVANHPLTGTGLGTFEWAYAANDREGEWQGTIQAHNDYLQLAAETGAVGIVLLLWMMVAFAWLVLRPVVAPARGQPRWTSLALVGAVFAILLHAVIEFSLQIPAVSALFAVVLGTLVAAAGDAPHGAEAA
jgi:O-antigen ligase